VGTFNVNGKLPSQDLSTWLGMALPSSGTHDNEHKDAIPPLRELSQLSLSDKGASHPSHGAGKSSPFCGFYIMADSSAFAETEGQVSAPEADVLVMAFQEADLSTEAFFNFTGPAREDAWTAAIFAALGETAERYEKVNLSVVTA
jgi:phosphatidylinositol-bisphosphatase